MSRAVRDAYRNGKEDETLPPLVLFDRKGRPVGRLKKGDPLYTITSREKGNLNLPRA